MSELQPSPTDYKFQLGEVLTRLRTQAGKARRDAAAALNCSEGKIGKIERGHSGVNQSELRVLLGLYNVTEDEYGDLEALAAEARERQPRTPWGAAIPERLRRFFRIEETARRIRCYDTEYLHGLTQTPDYARAVIGTNPALTASDADRLLQARMARQARLVGPRPVELSLVLPESAFRMPVGSREVMRAQLQHLINLATQPNIEIRMIPSSVGAHHGRGCSFAILTPAVSRKTVVYLENLTDGLFIDEQQRVERYLAAYEHLLSVALPVDDTVKALATVAAEL